MVFHADAVARVQAAAFTAHDTPTFANQLAQQVRVLRDGRLIGRGPKAVEQGLAAEYHEGGYARFAHLDGEPVIAECAGDPEHPHYKGVIRLHHVGDLIDEVRFDHDPAILQRIQR